MNFLDFLEQGIVDPIIAELSLLQDETISEFLFDGDVNLWQVICCFFVGALLIKFILSPVRLSSFGASNISHAYDVHQANQEARKNNVG